MKKYLPLKWTFSEAVLTDVANCVHANFQYQSFEVFFQYSTSVKHSVVIAPFLFPSKKMFRVRILLPKYFPS